MAKKKSSKPHIFTGTIFDVLRRADELFARYNIKDTNDSKWMLLAVQLAAKYEPGFKLPKFRLPRAKDSRFKLIMAVERPVLEDGISEAQSLHAFASAQGRHTASIVSRYYEYRKEIEADPILSVVLTAWREETPGGRARLQEDFDAVFPMWENILRIDRFSEERESKSPFRIRIKRTT